MDVFWKDDDDDDEDEDDDDDRSQVLIEWWHWSMVKGRFLEHRVDC